VIGRHFIKFLRARGEDVFAPNREDDSIFSRPLGHVIYAIGITADFRTRPIDTVQSHVCMLADILQRADFASLIYLSSTRVYMGASTSSEDNTFYVRPQDPSDLYNLSKLMGESLCLFCGREGVKIARLSNVVGGEDHDSDNFIPSLIRDARKGKISLRTDLSSTKDYIHIDDVASLLYEIARTGQSDIYNVASGRQVTHAEWVNRLASLTGCSVEVEAEAPVVQCVPIDVKRVSDEFRFQAKSVFDALLSM
jgi:nucleoside-diphosphate-sugar epimerase